MCPIHCRTAASPPEECRCTGCHRANHGQDHLAFFQGVLLTRADCGDPAQTLTPEDVAQLITDLPDWIHDETGTQAIQWLLAQGLADPERGSGGGGGGHLQTHALCSAIVLLVRAVEASDNALKTAADYAAKVLTQTSIASFVPGTGKTPAERLFVELAGIAASRAAPALLGVDTFLTQIRLAAILVCPDPDEHPDIVKHCLQPLVESGLSEDLILAARRAFQENAGDAASPAA
jgi:hypothetical protein